MADSPFIRDVPAARALAAWRAAREAAGCPARLPGVAGAGGARRPGLVTAEPVWAIRSSPPFDAAGMDGIAVRAADTLGASETTPVDLPPGAYDVVDTGDPMPAGRDAVVMREHVHYQARDRASCAPPCRPYQHVRSIGEDVSAGELLLPEGHRLRAADVAAAAAAGATQLLVRRPPGGRDPADRGRGAADRRADRRRARSLDTNSLMLATQAREAGCEAHCLPIEPDDPDAHRGRGQGRGHRLRPADHRGRARAPGGTTTRPGWWPSTGTLAVHGVAVRPGHPVVLGVVGAHPGARRARLSRCRPR